MVNLLCILSMIGTLFLVGGIISGNPIAIMLLIIIIICIIALKIHLDSKAKEELSHHRNTFTYNGSTHGPGTELLIKKPNSSEAIRCVWLYYDLRDHKHYYEAFFGTNIYWATDDGFASHLQQLTGRRYDLNEFRSSKARYNSFAYECPMCKSHLIKNISSGRKRSDAFFSGVGANTLFKNYECDSCKYKW